MQCCICDYQNSKRDYRIKLYHKFGFEKLSFRRWMQCLRHRYQLLINRLLSYQPSIIPQPRSNIQTCSTLRNPSLKTRAVAFQNSFFSEYEWNKLNITLLGSTLSLSFVNTILKEVRPNSIFCIHNWLGLKI